MKKTMKLISLILAMLMLVGCAAACGKSGGDDKAEKKVLNLYLGADCDTLNAHITASSEPGTPASYCSAYLYRAYPNDTSAGEARGYHYVGDLAKELPELVSTDKVMVKSYAPKKDADGNVIAGEFDVTEAEKDVQTWKIVLRDGIKWNNGDPITAEEIVWGWEMLAKPELVNAMGSFLYGSVDILNAKNYHIGAMKWSDVGITYEGNTITIKVVGIKEAKNICANFENRALTPVKKSIYEQGLAEGTSKWGTTLDNWMGCGPYVFSNWVEDSVQTYVKNPDHWLADLYHYDEVHVNIVKDMNTRVQMFESGKLTTLTPDATVIDKYLDDPRLQVSGSVYVDHIDINCKNTDNPLSLIEENYYRKALYHAFDRATYAKDIFGRMEPAGYYVNGQAGLLSADGRVYRETEYGKAVVDKIASWSDPVADPSKTGYNPALARDYMKKAFQAANMNWDDASKQEIKYVVGGSDTAWQNLFAVIEEKWEKEIFVNEAGNSKIDLVFISQGSLSSTNMKIQFGDNGWDLSPNSWGRGNSRIDVFDCFYYYTEQYSGRPNNYLNKAFDAQYVVCQNTLATGNYEQLLKETQKLEEIYLDCVIHVPIYQTVSYDLFTENLILPTDKYIPSFGWGTSFGDLDMSK